ncbi:MAG: pilus assembly protein [Acidobacteria bacterium]|nr:pilus assembly protein [Acidobacteriota bacterium]
MMMRRRKKHEGERGSTLLEFSISSIVFLTSLFAMLDFGRLLWAHNALADAARRGARHAVSNSVSSTTPIKNIVVYGNVDGTGTPLLPGLTANHVMVEYNGIGLGRGTATVSINGYQFSFVTTLFGLTMNMPEYSTTLTGETVGFSPPRL